MLSCSVSLSERKAKLSSLSLHVRAGMMKSSFALCFFSPHKFLNTNFAAFKLVKREKQHEVCYL